MVANDQADENDAEAIKKRRNLRFHSLALTQRDTPKRNLENVRVVRSHRVDADDAFTKHEYYCE